MKGIVAVALILLSSCSGSSSLSAGDRQAGDAEIRSAVEHYYDLFARVRETGRPDLIDPCTVPEGPDRANVQAFSESEHAKGKLSVITRQSLSHWFISHRGWVVTAVFDYVVTGYDVDALTHRPLESPVTRPVDRVAMELWWQAGHWLVFSRQPA